MKNPYEKAKFIVTRNILVFISILILILVIVNLNNNKESLFTLAVAGLISILLLFYLIKSKLYLVPALLVIILGYSFNLYKTTNFEKFIDVFLLINLSIFTYFTLGKIIGHIYLVINITTIFILLNFFKHNYIEIIPMTSKQNFSISSGIGSNLIICSILFCYLITEFIQQNKRANLNSIQSNLELQKQYDEKSIMLKEIHHRVKNNLQIVTSLLRLQLHKIEDKNSVEPFQESIDRIASIALIHEKMYEGDKVKPININSYIKDTVDDLIKSYAHETIVNLNLNSSVKTIELNYIVPLSLILNELISNSLKHAFPNKKNGEITINISTEQSTSLILIYEDNGEWKVQEDANSFGLELIDIFTEQLSGKYTLETENGAEYCFNFKDILFNR